MGHSEDMGAECEFCAGKSFRRSHLQFRDVLALLLFRYPVRCLTCSKRLHVNLLVAYRALSSMVKQVRAQRDEAQWRGWNASGREAHRTMPAGALGRDFGALPSRTPISMPDLKGVALEHRDEIPASDETTV